MIFMNTPHPEAVKVPWNNRRAIISLMDMKEYPAVSIVWLHDSIVACYMRADNASDPVDEDEGDERKKEIAFLRKELPAIAKGLDDLGLVQSRHFADLLRTSLDGAASAIKGVAQSLYDLFLNELKATQFLRLEGAEVKLWKSAGDGFGTATTFPGAQYEASEAIRCHAIGRHTACVLHCMRALEFPLRAMCKSLKFEFKNDAWQKTIELLQSRMKSIERLGLVYIAI